MTTSLHAAFPFSLYPMFIISYLSFRIARLYSSFKGDAGLTPNAPVKDAGVRSTEASLPLAG